MIQPAVSSARTVSLALGCLAWSLAGTPCEGQSPQAFERLGVGISLVHNFNRSTVHEYWDAGLGAELTVSMPFYRGAVHFGAHYFPHSGRAPAFPDFQAWFLHAGWTHGVGLPLNMSWYGGVKVGLFTMSFDTDVRNNKESELGTALLTGVSYAPLPWWSVDVSARYQVVFTRQRLKYAFVTVGVGRSFTMPSWLRSFLQ